MRYLIALLAVLALLVNPVAVAAAQVACETSMPGMAQMASHDARMAKADATPQAAADPCCDHSGDGKMDGKACAEACATACALLAALPLAPESRTLTYTRALSPAVRLVWPRAHDPSRLDRPPKSMA